MDRKKVLILGIDGLDPPFDQALCGGRLYAQHKEVFGTGRCPI